MKTECSAGQLEFHGLGRRAVVGEFDGGKVSSDSSGLLLCEVEQRTHILKRLAGCFTDHRDAKQVEHSLESLIKQRVMGLALGYEDLNDHDTLRHDPLLALLSDKQDLSGNHPRGAKQLSRHLVKNFGTFKSPKSTRKRDAYCRPTPCVRATSPHSLKWLDSALDAYAAYPLALAHDGYATSGARLLGSTSLRFALHGWQRL
jgi:hypothetical protein